MSSDGNYLVNVLLLTHPAGSSGLNNLYQTFEILASNINAFWVISANSPKKLSEFYSLAINGIAIPSKDLKHYKISNKNGVNIQIFKPSIKNKRPIKGNQATICLTQDPCENPIVLIQDWISSLKKLGATIHSPPISKAFGAESWLKDPEGNLFLIYIPNAN